MRPTSLAIRPIPISPRLLPRSSCPVRATLDAGVPDWLALSASTMFRRRASRRAIECSATDTVLAFGVLVTRTPRGRSCPNVHSIYSHTMAGYDPQFGRCSDLRRADPARTQQDRYGSSRHRFEGDHVLAETACDVGLLPEAVQRPFMHGKRNPDQRFRVRHWASACGSSHAWNFPAQEARDRRPGRPPLSPVPRRRGHRHLRR